MRTHPARRTAACSASAVAAVLAIASCSASSHDSRPQRTSPPSSAAAPSTARSSTPASSSGTTAPASPAHKAGPASYFTPTKLKPGQKPPQFVVISFDGAGWHQKWQFWQGVAARVPLRFTGFLTGLYLLDKQHKDAYRGPGHRPGKTSLGSWNSPADVAQEVTDLNTAWAHGDEIGTHFNGHFCEDNKPGGRDWNTADWNSELDQFFSFVKNYRTIDALPSLPKLDFPASEIKGERTPCLEGHPGDFVPALRRHGMIYDSSPTRRGLSWPVKTAGVWRMGMAEFPVAGTKPPHFQITMDYNFWFSQEHASSSVPPQRSARDSKQTQATYQNMFDAAYAGNRAPLILGNHFESWNNNAYTKALARFALANCGKPDVRCVPFIDVIRWMQAQDPSVLAHLQSLPAELGPPRKP